MPIIHPVIHEPSIEKIEKEEQVIPFLNEIKSSLSSVLGRVFSLREILNVAEKAQYESKDPNNSNYSVRVDLSKAKALISEYRKKSEGGCTSCKAYGHFRPMSDEHVFYCIAYEKNPSKMDFGNSPMISKYREKGCPEIKSEFGKTIEKIIEEAEKN